MAKNARIPSWGEEEIPLGKQRRRRGIEGVCYTTVLLQYTELDYMGLV